MNCPNCGANLITLRCDYCGSEYNGYLGNPRYAPEFFTGGRSGYSGYSGYGGYVGNSSGHSGYYMDKRLEAMNEFRNTLKDQATHFLTRTENNKWSK